MNLADRFWDKVEVKGFGDCWPWNGATNQYGYGNIGLGSGKYGKAHRLAWELHFGPIPDGMEVCHHCDNPGCVNPAHLFVGTHQDNMTDMKLKGRAIGQPGSENCRASLTETEVIQIRGIYDWYVCHGQKYGLLKRMTNAYRMPYSTLRKIVKHYTWEHVGKE